MDKDPVMSGYTILFLVTGAITWTAFWLWSGTLPSHMELAETFAVFCLFVVLDQTRNINKRVKRTESKLDALLEKFNKPQSG